MSEQELQTHESELIIAKQKEATNNIKKDRINQYIDEEYQSFVDLHKEELEARRKQIKSLSDNLLPKWNLIKKYSITDSDLKLIKKAIVVPDPMFGKAIFFHLNNGGNSSIPLLDQNDCNIGDTIDLQHIQFLTFHKDGHKDRDIICLLSNIEYEWQCRQKEIKDGTLYV